MTAKITYRTVRTDKEGNLFPFEDTFSVPDAGDNIPENEIDKLVTQVTDLPIGEFSVVRVEYVEERNEPELPVKVEFTSGEQTVELQPTDVPQDDKVFVTTTKENTVEFTTGKETIEIMKEPNEDVPQKDKIFMTTKREATVSQDELDSLTKDVRSHNVGNSDYAKHKIQPWDIWLEYQLNPWEADIVKRIVRTKAEGGMSPLEARLLDFQKIEHIAQELQRQIKAGEYYSLHYNKEK